MKKLVIGLLTCFLWDGAYAANAWYWGEVVKIQTLGGDGSFQVQLENQHIKDFCTDDKVNFLAVDMGVERTKIAFSMALAAFASGVVWGVVVDLPTSESVCNASATASQGAGIQK